MATYNSEFLFKITVDLKSKLIYKLKKDILYVSQVEKFNDRYIKIQYCIIKDIICSILYDPIDDNFIELISNNIHANKCSNEIIEIQNKVLYLYCIESNKLMELVKYRITNLKSNCIILYVDLIYIIYCEAETYESYNYYIYNTQKYIRKSILYANNIANVNIKNNKIHIYFKDYYNIYTLECLFIKQKESKIKNILNYRGDYYTIKKHDLFYLNGLHVIEYYNAIKNEN